MAVTRVFTVALESALRALEGLRGVLPRRTFAAPPSGGGERATVVSHHKTHQNAQRQGETPATGIVYGRGRLPRLPMRKARRNMIRPRMTRPRWRSGRRIRAVVVAVAAL